MYHVMLTVVSSQFTTQTLNEVTAVIGLTVAFTVLAVISLLGMVVGIVCFVRCRRYVSTQIL